MISTLLTVLLIGIVALVTLSVVGAVLGLAFGLIAFLLFKVAPIMLVGYVVLRLIKPKPKQLSAEDRRWLES
jgi:hypothetical protein